MEQLAGRPYWTLDFTADAVLRSPDQQAFLDEVAASGVRELFVLSHGWNTGEADAEDLYQSLGSLVSQALPAASGLGSVGFVGVHWPALWFPDRPASGADLAGGGDAQSSAPPAAAAVSADQQLTGTQLAQTLRDSFDDEARTAVDRLGQLIDEGAAAAAGGQEPEERQQARLAEFHDLLQRLLPEPTAVTDEDRGELALLASDDPARDYAFIAGRFGGPASGGSAQGLQDTFRNVWRGAKDVLRVASYYLMKARAGKVGKDGLGPLLSALHDRSPQIRVHLVGHSFGGRLVAFTLSGIPSAASSPVASLVLVQAAFSHYAFSVAKDNPFGAVGALRDVADRVHGPLVATHSTHDFAVGRWYPLASALARQDNQDRPDVSRWGGLGADGFQAVDPLETCDLLAHGADYAFVPGHFYGVDGTAVINNWRQDAFAGAHSDIRRPEVAWLLVAAAASA